MDRSSEVGAIRHKIRLARQSIRRCPSKSAALESVISDLNAELSSLISTRIEQDIVLHLDGNIPVYKSDIQRLNSNLRLVEDTGCWLWTGYVAKRGKGYGEIHIGGGFIMRVHRLVWLLTGHLIPDDKPNVLHNCPGGDNRLCCNPEHLWVGTHLDNQRDKASKGRGCKSRLGLPFGVRRRGRKFEANVRVDHKLHYLGRYDTAEEAGEVAAAAKRELRA